MTFNRPSSPYPSPSFPVSRLFRPRSIFRPHSINFAIVFTSIFSSAPSLTLVLSHGSLFSLRFASNSFFLTNNCLRTPLCFPIMFPCSNFFTQRNGRVTMLGPYVLRMYRHFKVAKSLLLQPHAKDFHPTIVFALPHHPIFVCPYHVSCTNFLHSTEKKAELRVMMLGVWCYRPSKWAKVFLSQSIHVLA